MKEHRTVADPTPKQRRFADAVMSGEWSTITECYLQVYGGGDGSGKPTRSQRNEASRAWRSAPVIALAEAGRAAVEAKRARRELSQRGQILSRLWEEVDGAIRSSDRISALKILAQANNLLSPQQVSVNVQAGPASMSDAEVIAEIEAELSSITLGPQAELETGDSQETDPEV